MKKIETTIYDVIETSVVDREKFFNSTPCADMKTAKVVMDYIIKVTLKEVPFLLIKDLDELEYRQGDPDCRFEFERDETHFSLKYDMGDEYAEEIEIVEKTLLKYEDD